MTAPVLRRLREAASEAKSAEQAWRDALAERDQLLIETYGRFPLREIAAAALVNPPRVIHLVARSG